MIFIIFTHSKICFVCISKVICTVHVTSVNIKFISEDLDWELQKDIFADQNISTIYMYLKHDQKLWSLWKVLQNISTVFSVWIKAWTWHMEVWVFFLVRCRVDIPVRLLKVYLDRDTLLVSSLSCQRSLEIRAD